MLLDSTRIFNTLELLYPTVSINFPDLCETVMFATIAADTIYVMAAADENN